MKRILLILLITALAVPLTGCAGAPAGETPEPSESVSSHQDDIDNGDVQTAETHAMPPETELPAETENPRETEAPQAEIIDWQGIYKKFLTENYEAIADACLMGVVGVGFIDLDIDGAAELIIFDAGATTSMGVQIFDIVDGEVTCVSAHMEAVGEEFGGDYLSDVKINANLFSDFHLMKSNVTGEYVFFVESVSGGIDFSYLEIIGFENADNIVVSVSYMDKQTEIDSETGEITSVICHVFGLDAGEEEFDEVYKAFYSGFSDADYEASGAFIWESSGYESGYDGFMSMVEVALKSYTPIPES